MENAHIKQEHKQLLGIDKLMAGLTRLHDETQRLKRDKVESLIRLMVNEIPYAYLIIPNTLAESLLADAPLDPNNLNLNEVIANLGFALFDAQQITILSGMIQTYLTQRKVTEKAYAAALLPEILRDDDLAVFPEKARPELKNIAHTILEKVINEKQLRKTPGYRLESLIAVVEPIIYHRLFNPELDRSRITHHLAFRKLVNAIAQDGYEKIHDDAKLTIIQKEKRAAFEQLYLSIAARAVVYPELETEHEKLRFLQKDKIDKNIELQKLFDEFFKAKSQKTIEGILAQQLRIRFTDRLRKQLLQTDIQPEIYENEFTIKQAHDAVFKQLKDDYFALKYSITKIKSIRENYHKKFLQIFAKSKELAAIDAALLDATLGKAVVKVDLFTGEKHSIREIGGYPKANVNQIYTTLIASLQAIDANLSGIFSNQLKYEIGRVLADLRKVETKISTLFAEEERVDTITAEQPEPAAPIERAQVETIQIKEKEAPEPVEEVKAAEQQAPVAKEEVKENVIEEKIVPKPLIIEEEEVTPPAPTPVVAEKPEPIVTQAPAQPEPLPTPEEEEVKLEKVAPTPLIIEEEPEPTVEQPVAAVAHDQATQEILDSGAMIMKNYQLGDFEKPIYEAWKLMSTSSSDTSMDTGAGLNFSSDNDVRLYVICDLAQQVSGINVAQLSDEQKQILQGIKSELIEALKNPLDEANWDHFEGSHRDIIDGKLNMLM